MKIEELVDRKTKIAQRKARKEKFKTEKKKKPVQELDQKEQWTRVLHPLYPRITCK